MSKPCGIARLVGASAIALSAAATVFAPIPARSDSARFVRAARGVVDMRSGLTWSHGSPRFLGWDSAREHCARQGVAWRLPSVSELGDVVVATASGSEALAREVFGRASGAAYWSKDMRSRREQTLRLAVDEDGSVTEAHRLSSLAVRCVRVER